MNNNPNASFVQSNTEGFARANNSDYAYIAESTTIDYQVQRMCKLKQIGGLLDSKGYGLAFPKGNLSFLKKKTTKNIDMKTIICHCLFYALFKSISVMMADSFFSSHLSSGPNCQSISWVSTPLQIIFGVEIIVSNRSRQ